MAQKIITGAERSLILTELGRFFEVAAEYRLKTGGKSAMMPKCVVDSAWHDLLDKPQELRDLVDLHLGIEMEVAHLKSSGNGLLDWVSVYESRFGKLPLPWFVRPDDSVDDEALAHYEQTGEVRMSWDCTPGITKKKAA
ncbi:MAG: hypothetical protein WCG84_02080 [Candidatus Moraniibacteriota bacterium]